MKYSGVFCLVLVALAAQRGEAATPLQSIVRDILVNVLEGINGLAGLVEKANDDFLTEKLKNYTSIKEWSVNIQTKVAVGAAKLGLGVFEAFKLAVEASVPTALESKLLDCVANQSDKVIATVRNATIQNGFCNNRLAPNLTLAFQEVTKSLLKINADLHSYAEDLKGCWWGDNSCTQTYNGKVADEISKTFLNPSSDLRVGVSHAIAIYKVMFGQDVPECNKKFLFPILNEGLRSSFDAVIKCVA